jgi:outer membrane lipoprotein-sorting protein
LRKENFEMIRKQLAFFFNPIGFIYTVLFPHPSPLPQGERDEVRGLWGGGMKYLCTFFSLLLLGFFLTGCPKRVEMPPPEKPPFENPIVKLLEAFSSTESLQARASIRIDVVRNGDEMSFLLNGIVLYQKPDRLRLLGYHPLGMGLFDAIYRNGELSLLLPIQKKAYTGEVSQFEDLIEKAGEIIKVSSEKEEGRDVPSRIRIEVVEKEIRIDLRLKEIVINPSLPEDSFQWVAPKGVEVRPLTSLLKGKKLK